MISDQYVYPPTASVAYVAKTAGTIIAIAQHFYITLPRYERTATVSAGLRVALARWRHHVTHSPARL